jgi:hypothetical protein
LITFGVKVRLIVAIIVRFSRRSFERERSESRALASQALPGKKTALHFFDFHSLLEEDQDVKAIEEQGSFVELREIKRGSVPTSSSDTKENRMQAAGFGSTFAFVDHPLTLGGRLRGINVVSYQRALKFATSTPIVPYSTKV